MSIIYPNFKSEDSPCDSSDNDEQIIASEDMDSCAQP